MSYSIGIGKQISERRVNYHALLHLKQEKILSVTIQNPIILGEAIEDKSFILDIQILLNNSLYIDLELQIENEATGPAVP